MAWISSSTADMGLSSWNETASAGTCPHGWAHGGPAVSLAPQPWCDCAFTGRGRWRDKKRGWQAFLAAPGVAVLLCSGFQRGVSAGTWALSAGSSLAGAAGAAGRLDPGRRTHHGTRPTRRGRPEWAAALHSERAALGRARRQATAVDSFATHLIAISARQISAGAQNCLKDALNWPALVPAPLAHRAMQGGRGRSAGAGSPPAR